MRILIIDDEARFASVLARALAAEGFADIDTAVSGEEGLDILRDDPCDIVVTDLRLPGMSGLDVLGAIKHSSPSVDVILMTAFADVATARDALKRGARDYLVKPFDNAELVRLIEQARAQRPEVLPVTPRLVAGMVGTSEPMRRLFADIEKIAASDVSVLILGESGTGKELAARAMSHLGPRHGGPFIEVHIAALAESVLESELFGHERGAFTGADHRRVGLCEMAAGGTLFLDEIGKLPLHLQPKLLRFLQERRFYRVGGTQPITVDVRVVAATNRDLSAEVAAGRFREDLFYRLDVATISLPPLRQRREDIPLLVRHFLDRLGGPSVTVGDAAMAAMRSYMWPGNIRELQNAMQRAVINAGAGNRIELHHLPHRLSGSSVTQSHAASANGSDRLDLTVNERQLIEQALVKAAGNKTRAAELLGITRRRLYSRLKVLGMAHGDADPLADVADA